MLYLTPPEQLDELLAGRHDEFFGPGRPAYRVDQIRAWLYETPVLSVDEMTNLPATLRGRLAGSLWPFELEAEQVADDGRTRKWLFRTPDGKAIEAVLMGYPRRTTLCLSSQAGCALACTFCATGQFGFERHLEAGEIVAQVAFAQAFLRTVGLPGSPDHLTNVVFMGMGEPLANYRRVREAIRVMIDVMGLSARSLTVSTVGMVPGIKKLAGEPWPVNLAVSLHAADDELRSRLLPINDRYPLEQVIDAARFFFESKSRRVSIEWTMMDNVNDSAEQAEKLAVIARRMGAHINLIALNPTPLSAESPTPDGRIREFARLLRTRGANVTIRDTRGRDIDAACGQLRLRVDGGEPARAKLPSPAPSG